MKWEQLVGQYKRLLEMASDTQLDQGVFKLKHDELASRYKKLTMADQGEYTHAIVNFYEGYE